MNLVKTLESTRSIDLYVDISGSKNSTVITGKSQRPGVIVTLANKLFIIELTAGYETYILINSNWKERNIKTLIDKLSHSHKSMQFVNSSIGALNVYGKTCESLVSMLRNLKMTKSKLIMLYANCNVCIGCLNFCCRSRE